MRIVGFTGTRAGMTIAQCSQVRVKLVGADQLHHGMCKGSDAQAHAIAKYELGIWTVGHPPKDHTFMAKCDVDERREDADYLDRDYDIANESTELIATPRTHFEELRSGTWATVRYAIQLDKPITIIFPDGSMEVRR